jgi:hypothetical protein
MPCFVSKRWNNCIRATVEATTGGCRQPLVYSRQLLVYSRQLLVYSRQLLVHSRQLLVYSRQLLVYSRQLLVYSRDVMLRVATLPARCELDVGTSIGMTNTGILNERVVRVLRAPSGANGFGSRPRRREPNIPRMEADTTVRSAHVDAGVRCRTRTRKRAATWFVTRCGPITRRSCRRRSKGPAQ